MAVLAVFEFVSPTQRIAAGAKRHRNLAPAIIFVRRDWLRVALRWAIAGSLFQARKNSRNDTRSSRIQIVML